MLVLGKERFLSLVNAFCTKQWHSHFSFQHSSFSCESHSLSKSSTSNPFRVSVLMLNAFWVLGCLSQWHVAVCNRSSQIVMGTRCKSNFPGHDLVNLDIIKKQLDFSALVLCNLFAYILMYVIFGLSYRIGYRWFFWLIASTKLKISGNFAKSD